MAQQTEGASDVSYETTTISTQDGSSSEDEPVPPFFNTTFSTHRLSPLFIGQHELDQARLDQLAHRLRDTLVGDVVRGIQITLESVETSVGQVGPLRYVRFRWFQPSDVLGDHETAEEELGRGRRQPFLDDQTRGLWIEIRHENAAYIAILLPGYSSSPADVQSSKVSWAMQPGQTTNRNDLDENRFVHLPLLLLRMPLALKNVISDWLSTTFDCRVSKLSLGTKTLVNVWEGWIETAGLSNKGPDFVVTLSFNAPLKPKANETGSDSDEEQQEGVPEAGLKSLSVAISPQDLRRFLRAGQTLGPMSSSRASAWEKDPRERRRLAGGNSDDGWAWRANADTDQPFTEALGRYINHHLALNMFHPSVRVVQISCGGFMLAQSRLKIVRVGEITEELSRAAWMFATQLGARIQGEGLPSVVPTGVP